MNVAFLAKFFPKLSETFILSQAVGVLERGHELTVFARRRGDRQVHAAVRDYGLLERTRYWPRGGGRRAAAVSRAVGRLAASPSGLGATGGLLLRGHAGQGWGLFCTAAGAPRNHFDIAHAHFGPSGHAGALLKASGLFRGALLTSFYGKDVTAVVREQGPACYRAVFAASDRVLALSTSMRDRLEALGCPPKKLVVHHLSVDTERFAYSEPILTPGEPVRLLSIGRLIEKKGFEDALRAVARVRARHPRLEYRIIGTGPRHAELEALVEAHGLGDVVELLGPRLQDKVREEIARSHVLLAPSVSASDGDEEGTPTVILEALAMGRPVLATHHSGIPEQVTDGVSGYLVPERDPDALAGRLHDLLDDPGAWPAMARAGRAHVVQEFDARTQNDRLMALYDAVRAEKRANARETPPEAARANRSAG